MVYESAAHSLSESGHPPRLMANVLFWGRVAVVALLLTISPLALVSLNWQYFDTGGGFADKFHPATLIAFALLALAIVTSRNPVTEALAFAHRNADLIPFVLAISFTIVYAGLVLGHSVTIFIETFLGAVAMFVLFAAIDNGDRRKLALIVHALLFMNALLAFYEVFSGFRLTPLVVNGEVLLDEPRATALLGHPLANAMLAGAYVTILALGGTKDLPQPLRTPAFLVALASLIPFGGRAATAACLLTLLMVGAGMAIRLISGARFSKSGLLSALVIVPVCALAVVMANEMGWLDTLLNRLVEDEGSAGTRIVMFELFDHFSFTELFWGPDPLVLMTWVRLYGLEYGIESFVVAFVLHYGLLASLVFFPNLFYFLYLLVVETGTRRTWFVVFYFVVVALASVSLSSKSPILSMFVVMVLLLLRGRDAELPQDEKAE